MAYAAMRRTDIEVPNGACVITHFSFSLRVFKPYVASWVPNTLRFVLSQARGLPDGPHGDLARYNIDGLTFRFEQKNIPVEISAPVRSLENLIRSINNLNEHLHQSFYYYLITDLFSYIPIGDYMIFFGMVIGGTVLFVRSLLLLQSL